MKVINKCIWKKDISLKIGDLGPYTVISEEYNYIPSCNKKIKFDQYYIVKNICPICRNEIWVTTK